MIGRCSVLGKALAALLVLGLLVSCGRPIGVMQAAGTVPPGTSRVDLLVATTRAADENPAILFSGERGSGLMVDAVDVSIPPEANRKVGQVQWPRRLPADPLKDFVTVAVDPLNGEKAGENWLRTHMPKSKRVLIFVHGFNNRYEDAVYRFAQIVAAAALCLEISASAAMATAGSANFFQAHHERGGLR